MSEKTQLVYQFKAGWLGGLFLLMCGGVPGVFLLLLWMGWIEGTTANPLLGAFLVWVIGVAMGGVLAGWHSRTVIDRRTQTVTDHWSIFGFGPTRNYRLSDFDRVVVRRWVRWNGRIRRRVLLAGQRCEVQLAGFYTLGGARESGRNVAAFCGLALVEEDRLGRFWST